MEDLLIKEKPVAKPTDCQIGAWEEVAEEENYFEVNKVIEKEESDLLGKRPRLLFETEQESDLADIK